MHRHLLVALAVPLVLTGCSSHGSRTTSPSPSPSPPAPSTASPTATPSTTATPAPSTQTSTSTPVTSTACITSRLRLTVRQAGAAAGTAYWALDLQNVGNTHCTLTGYPGVSFTDAAGHQLGLPAARTAAQPEAKVALAPGGYAHATVGVPNPANFQVTTDPSSSTCRPAETSLVRLYPPNQRAALTARLRTSVCTTSAGQTSVTTVSAGRVTGPAG